MRPDDPDAGYLWDMLDAARTVREFASNTSSEQYMTNGPAYGIPLAS